MLPGICCIYFPNPFLISARAPITIGIVVAFIPHIHSTSFSRSLYFEKFSVTLTEVFFSVGMDISISRQPFFLFVVDHNIWSLGLYLTISLYWHISQDCDVVFFSYCLWLMLVPFLVCVYINFFTDVPVEVCGGFVVAV